MSAQQPGPPAGWYPDPEMRDTTRYWDGSTWTDHRAPRVSSPQAVAVAERPNLTGGYVLAVLLPFIGVIYGLVKIKDGGGAVIAVSIVAWIVWAMVFSSL